MVLVLPQHYCTGTKFLEVNYVGSIVFNVNLKGLDVEVLGDMDMYVVSTKTCGSFLLVTVIALR